MNWQNINNDWVFKLAIIIMFLTGLVGILLYREALGIAGSIAPAPTVKGYVIQTPAPAPTITAVPTTTPIPTRTPIPTATPLPAIVLAEPTFVAATITAVHLHAVRDKNEADARLAGTLAQQENANRREWIIDLVVLIVVLVSLTLIVLWVIRMLQTQAVNAQTHLLDAQTKLVAEQRRLMQVQLVQAKEQETAGAAMGAIAAAPHPATNADGNGHEYPVPATDGKRQ